MCQTEMALNGQGLTFFGRESQNLDGPQLRGSGSKFENIREQNQNRPNLKNV